LITFFSIITLREPSPFKAGVMSLPFPRKERLIYHLWVREWVGLIPVG
jgi:hypothetical protein